MKTIQMRSVALVGALMLPLLPTSLLAQQAPIGIVSTTDTPGKVSAVEAVQAAARVEAIDAATRSVTLIGEEGRRFGVVAGPDVRNFEQIKVGDEVVIEYIRATSLQVRKSTGVRELSEQTAGERAQPGDKPAGAIGRQVTVVADVIALDRTKSTITLRGPERNVIELDVRNPEHFDVVKVGDQVEANFIESVAISVNATAATQGR